METKLKIIIYNPQQFDLVFSIATISKQAPGVAIIAITAEATDLTNPDFWKNQIPIAEEVYNETRYYEDDRDEDRNINESCPDKNIENSLNEENALNDNRSGDQSGDYYYDDDDYNNEDDDNDFERELSDEAKLLEKIKQVPLYILGLGPQEDSDIPHIFDFFDQNEKRIVLWLDDHSWKSEELKYLKNKIRVLKKETYLENLEQLGYTSPDDWKDMERMMLTGEETYAPLIVRWRQALLVSLILIDNLKDQHHLSNTLSEIVNELTLDKFSEEIDTLCAIFPDMEESTEAAMEELSLQSNFFSLSTADNIEVAFFDLGETKIYINLLQIMETTKKKHDNVVIYYSINGQSSLIMATKNPAISITDIQEALENYRKDLNLDKTIILRLIDGELVYQTKKSRAKKSIEKKRIKKRASIKVR